MLVQFSPSEDSNMNLKFNVNIEKSSSIAAYEYFSAKLSEMRHSNVSACTNPKFYFGSSVFSFHDSG